EEPASAREGQVIRTSPTAGEQVTRSTPIVLYVAQGRAVVPDLASEHVSLAQAQERLVAAGFTSTPRVEQRDVDDTALVGRVVEQSPSAGETHDKTVPIVLWVGTLQHSASPSASTPATSSSAPPTSEGG
ncbi:MAG: PASTA domain-containing protein, partial [Brooklawnia sp.]